MASGGAGIEGGLRCGLGLARVWCWRSVAAAHERVRVVGRDLERVAVRAGLPVRAVAAVGAVLPRGALGSGRARLALRTRRACRTVRAGAPASP
ncbi:hypothetical protein SALBM135S_02761 [Streptomyces alboniger]